MVAGEEIAYAGWAYSTSVPSALQYFISGPPELPVTRPEWDGRSDTQSVTIGSFTP